MTKFNYELLIGVNHRDLEKIKMFSKSELRVFDYDIRSIDNDHECNMYPYYFELWKINDDGSRVEIKDTVKTNN